MLFFIFYSSKNPKNTYNGFHRNIKQHNVFFLLFFYIDNNNKCFLSTN